MRILFFLSLFLMQFVYAAIEIIPFSPKDLALRRFGANNGQQPEALVVQNYLKPGFTVFDVGANSGQWSSIALMAQPTIRLFAFEPIPNQYPIADFPEVELYQLALSDKQGKGFFYYVTDSTILSSLYARSTFSNNKVQKIEVELDTLDHFCAVHKVDHIDYLKIDTEGAELAVLKGAQNLLDGKRITALQFEYGGCYKDAGITLKEVMKLLSKAGYTLFLMIHPHYLMHIARWHPCLEDYELVNYFAILQSEVPEYEPIPNFQIQSLFPGDESGGH